MFSINTFWSWLLKFAIFVWMLNIAWFGYLTYENYSSLPFQRTDIISVEDHVFRPGDSLHIYYKSIERHACNIRYTRYLEDITNRRQVIVQSGDFVTEGNNTPRDIYYDIHLPNTLRPGPYQLYTIYHFNCNIIDAFFSRTHKEVQLNFMIVG